MESGLPSGKTKKFVIEGTGHEPVGCVWWFDRRREYCFSANEVAVFYPDRLNSIADFLRELNAEHKKARKAS